jgi:hypothetical protein
MRHRRGGALWGERDALVFRQLYGDWSGLDIYRNLTKVSNNFARKQTVTSFLPSSATLHMYYISYCLP